MRCSVFGSLVLLLLRLVLWLLCLPPRCSARSFPWPTPFVLLYLPLFLCFCFISSAQPCLFLAHPFAPDQQRRQAWTGIGAGHHHEPACPCPTDVCGASLEDEPHSCQRGKKKCACRADSPGACCLQSEFLSWALGGATLHVSCSSEIAHGLRQFALLCGCHALLDSGSWLASLVLAPASASKAYLPSMPENTMALLHKASPYVGWYRCPKGMRHFGRFCPHDVARRDAAVFFGTTHVLSGLTFGTVPCLPIPRSHLHCGRLHHADGNVAMPRVQTANRRPQPCCAWQQRAAD